MPKQSRPRYPIRTYLQEFCTRHYPKDVNAESPGEKSKQVPEIPPRESRHHLIELATQTHDFESLTHLTGHH